MSLGLINLGEWSLSELEITVSTRLTGQWAPEIHLSLPYQVLDACCHAWLRCWYQEAGLCSSWFYPLSHHFRPISTANCLSSFTQNKALFPNTCLETFRYFISSHSFSSVAVRGVLCYSNTLKAYLRYFKVAHYSSIHIFLSLLPPFVPPSFLPSLSFTGTLLYNHLPARGSASQICSYGPRYQRWRDRSAKQPGMER